MLVLQGTVFYTFGIENKEVMSMKFAEKLKSIRKQAGMSQEQLAEKMMVSRQAITKWESDKGMPDIENLKQLSKLLDVSIDYLLDGREKMDLTVIREEINLDDYSANHKFRGRVNKKTGKKDIVVRTKYPNAEIHYLVAQQILTKSEKIIDLVCLVFADVFNIPQIINGFKNADKEFYLVDDGDKQFLVTVTDELIESRKLASKITCKTFCIGEFKFTLGTVIP
jgi:transcriptional regulator with XRE-family HTH domain